MAVIPSEEISESDKENESIHDVRGQEIPRRCFSNMLSSEKFRCWLRYEWLYSVTDREIFLGSNDFQIILCEHFPVLKTRKLLRSQWALIRRIIGRPRRFSATFLADERDNLRNRRRSLHYLQQVLSGSLMPAPTEHLDSLLTSLPLTMCIPPQLPPGTRVCVSLSTPICGLYLGVIQDSYSSSSTYTVLLEKPIYSTRSSLPLSDINHHMNLSDKEVHAVPVEDVYPLSSQQLPKSIPLSSLRCHIGEILQNGSSSNYDMHFRPFVPSTFMNINYCSPVRVSADISSSVSLHRNNPCPSEPFDQVLSTSKSPVPPATTQTCEHISGFSLDVPVAQLIDPQTNVLLCTSLVRLFKLLEQKQLSINTLKEMNDSAEAQLARNTTDLTVHFRHSYATLILHLDKLNQELKYHMETILMYVSTIAQEQNMSVNQIVEWRRRCDDEAQEIVSRLKVHQRRSSLDDCKVDLVAKLSCLLIHLCNLSDQRAVGLSLVCIEDLMKEIRQYLHPENLKSFELSVESFVGQIIHAVSTSLSSRCHLDYSLAPQTDSSSFYQENRGYI